MEPGKSYCMSISIRGLLESPKKAFNSSAKYVTHANGKPFTPDELRDLLYDELGKGHKVLPIGRCDNFDPVNGCMGHGAARD